MLTWWSSRKIRPLSMLKNGLLLSLGVQNVQCFPNHFQWNNKIKEIVIILMEDSLLDRKRQTFLRTRVYKKENAIFLKGMLEKSCRVTCWVKQNEQKQHRISIWDNFSSLPVVVITSLNILSNSFFDYYLASMKATTLLLALLIPIFLCDCPEAQSIQFRQKRLDNPFPIINNPYLNPSQQYLAKVQENIKNKQRVCAIKYLEPSKHNYSIANFNSKAEAQSQGWIVTHQGICGKCSTLQDLFVYLTTDLTRPVRSCGVKHFASHKHLRSCIKSLGFTDACTQVWLWNTLNTKKVCGLLCVISLILHRPYVINGELNKCLQCDQDKSGPIFKYQSGRTRRNSGIKSEIDRPVDEIYNMTHCYY